MYQSEATDQQTFKQNEINGNDCIYFVAREFVEYATKFNLTQNCTVYVVVQTPSTANNHIIMEGNGSQITHLTSNLANKLATGTDFTVNNGWDASLIMTRYMASGSNSEIENRLVNSTGNAGTDPLTLHKIGFEFSQGVTGYVCEIIGYDSDLSDDDQDAVETYLKNKWGSGI